jgi:ferrous iron transport protein A
MANAVVHLQKGGGGQISHFTNEHIAGKLMAMGVLPGSVVRVVRIAPFKGGYYLKVDGQNIVVRHDEASNIIMKENWVIEQL